MAEAPLAGRASVEKWDTRQIAGAVYGTISAAVIAAGWKGDTAVDLVFLLLGYVLVLWLAHSYADFVAHGGRKDGFADLRHTMVHEWPVAQSGLTVTAAAAATAALSADATTTQDDALVTCLVNLVVWQLIAYRSGPRVDASTMRVGLVVNTLIILLIIGIWVLFK